jgi:hypothetical protein
MELTLEPAEAALLKNILTRYLSDLRMEIHATDSYKMRQELKQDEVLVKGLIERLEQAGVTSA